MSVIRPNVPLRNEVETAALLLVTLNTENVTSTAYRSAALNFFATRRLVIGTTGPSCEPYGSMRTVTVPWFSLASEKV